MSRARPHKGVSIRLALLAASSVSALVVCEALLRFSGWAEMVVYTPSPEWGYLMTPSQDVYVRGHPVHINALGLRGAEVAAVKSPGRERILFIGDSVTYGGGQIRENELFCRVIASLAQRAGKAVEVVNLSAPGWSPQNWWRYVERTGLHEADIVVLVLPECDLARPLATAASFGDRRHASALRLVNVLRHLYVSWRFSFALRPPEAAADRIARENADAVKRLRERVGAGSLLPVLVPSVHPEYTRFWPLFERELPDPVDLRDALRDPALFLDDVHLNARGHHVVAEQVFRRLRELL